MRCWRCLRFFGIRCDGVNAAASVDSLLAFNLSWGILSVVGLEDPLTKYLFGMINFVDARSEVHHCCFGSKWKGSFSASGVRSSTMYRLSRSLVGEGVVMILGNPWFVGG